MYVLTLQRKHFLMRLLLYGSRQKSEHNVMFIKTGSHKTFLRSSKKALLGHELIKFSRGGILMLHMAAFLE